MKSTKSPTFHDGKLGAALAVKVKTNSKTSRVRKVDREGTVFVDLACESETDIDKLLADYLAKFFGFPTGKFEIISSGQSKARLVMILGADPAEIDIKLKNRKR